MPWVDFCCGQVPLRTGTIITGVIGMIVGLVTLIFVLLSNIKLRTIVIDTLPPEIVRIIVALNLAMTIFISLLLVIGAVKRNKWLMLPWVILAIMLAVGMALSVIYTAVVLIIKDHLIEALIWFIMGFIGVAIFTYLWVVVYSYYQLLEEEKGKGPYNFPYGRR